MGRIAVAAGENGRHFLIDIAGCALSVACRLCGVACLVSSVACAGDNYILKITGI